MVQIISFYNYGFIQNSPNALLAVSTKLFQSNPPASGNGSGWLDDESEVAPPPEDESEAAPPPAGEGSSFIGRFEFCSSLIGRSVLLCGDNLKHNRSNFLWWINCKRAVFTKLNTFYLCMCKSNEKYNSQNRNTLATLAMLFPVFFLPLVEKGIHATGQP